MSPYRTPAVLPPDPPEPRPKRRWNLRKAGFWAMTVAVQIAYAWLLQRR